MTHSGFLRVYRIYGRFLRVLAMVAGVLFFAMMVLVVANALARKVFNNPIGGTIELTEATMVLAVLLPMAFTQSVGGHIRVMLLTKSFSARARRILHAIAMVLGFLFAAWVMWATGRYALHAYQINEQVWGTIRFVIYPIKAAVPLGTGLLAVQFLLDAWRLLVVENDDEEENDTILI